MTSRSQQGPARLQRAKTTREAEGKDLSIEIKEFRDVLDGVGLNL